MRVMLKSLFLLLTTFAVLPAWHKCCGQDSAIVGEAQESSQQQISLQKPTVTSPNPNPSSQQATSPVNINNVPHIHA